MGYGDDLRPPASIPNACAAALAGQRGRAMRRRPPVQSEPMQSGNMRWVPGPPGIERPEASAPARYARRGRAGGTLHAGRPADVDQCAGRDAPDDIPDDAVLPPGRTPRLLRARQPAYNAPDYQPAPQRAPPALGPMRGPASTAASCRRRCRRRRRSLARWSLRSTAGSAKACSRRRCIGSARQVATIKQIGSYSCREMVGAGGARICPSTPSATRSTSPASRSPTGARSRSRTAGTARRKSRASCTTCSFTPARRSSRCWRRATTSITTTTSTWT